MTSEYMHTYDASLDDEFGEKTLNILLDGEESEMIFIDHPSSEMSVSSDRKLLVSRRISKSCFSCNRWKILFLHTNRTLVLSFIPSYSEVPYVVQKRH